MPTRHCDRPRWTIPAASYSAPRDSVPPATRKRNAARGDLPRAALCLAGFDTASRFPYALPASICRRRAYAGLTPDHGCRVTRRIPEPNPFTPSPSTSETRPVWACGCRHRASSAKIWE
jgi:hypothetical protein